MMNMKMIMNGDHEGEHDGEHEDDDEHEEEEHEDETVTTIENSYVDTTSFNLGTSFVNDDMIVGFSYGKIESDYGIPGHS